MDGPFWELLHGHLITSAGSEDEQRVARIAEEALRSFEELGHLHRAVSMFGSARTPPVERWGQLTREVAGALTRAGFAVITGGGPGLMDAANEGALEAGGTSVGLTIHLPDQEDPNAHLTVHVPFHYFFLRKLAFVKYACAFVCVPGGFGTLDELFEALNLKRSHKVEPFPVILVGGEYWEGLRNWLQTAGVGSGALSAQDLDAFEITDDPATVVARVRECHEGLCRMLGIHR
jgi:uncharacterized protein (TIGR00730 family)